MMPSSRVSLRITGSIIAFIAFFSVVTAPAAGAVALPSASPAAGAVALPPGSPAAGVDLAIVGLSGRCLDADVHTIGQNGTKVQLWECNNSPQQTWRAYYRTPERFRLVNQHSLQCLDGDLHHIHEDGAKVQLWECNSSQQQEWIVYVHSADDRAFSANNWASGVGNKWLDADVHGAGENGTKVQLWDYNGQLQQIFRWNRY